MTGARFDEVVMVDWSAAATPRMGRDSIWVANGTPHGALATAANWPTRRRALGALEAMLDAAVTERRRVLVGFDFAFGYPTGFAACLGSEGEPWERVWHYFAARIADGDDNVNNRFEVAAELNRHLGQAIFWGCPKASPSLSPKLKERPDGLAANPFSSLRQVDELAGNKIRSVWQLYGGVTVGSQVLMGLPYLERLRDRYGDNLSVWPQQTGFLGDPLARTSTQILVVEIWPTALRPDYIPGGIRDEQQVRWCVERSLEQQETTEGLACWFAPLAVQGLTDDARSAAQSEEGWILGVGTGP